MSAMYPVASNDTKEVLVFKIANNYYDIALAKGVTGLTPPVYGSTITDLLNRIAYYTATID